MKKVLKFQNSVKGKIESFALLDSRVRNCDISLNEDKAVMTAVLSFDGFSAKIEYSDYNEYRGYNFLEDNKNNAECLNTSFIFPFSELEYSIYDVHNAVNDREFVPLEFHTINERQYADEAVDTVTAFITRHIEELNNCDESIKAGLDKSFENGVATASKRMSVDEIKADKKKLEKHRRNMFLHRYDQSYFINFVCCGKKFPLQRWLAKMSAKGKLFTFEERYFEYLMENDFTVDNERLKARVKKNEKNALHSLLFKEVPIILGFALAGLILMLCNKLSAHIFYDGYEKLYSFVWLETIPLIIISIAMDFLLMSAVKKLFFKNKSFDFSFEKLFEGNKLVKILSVAVIVVTAVGQILMCSRCVAVNQNNFYYCESVGRQKYFEFSDVEIFAVEGWYDEYDEFQQDKEYILVFDKDYNNFIELYEDEYKKIPMDKIEIKGEYKTLQEFEQNYCTDE